MSVATTTASAYGCSGATVLIVGYALLEQYRKRHDVPHHTESSCSLSDAVYTVHHLFRLQGLPFDEVLIGLLLSIFEGYAPLAQSSKRLSMYCTMQFRSLVL